RRWVRRHQTLVASAVVLLVATTVALAIGATLLGQANARAEQRRLEAEQNYETARQAVERYFTRISDNRLLNEPHMARLRNDLLETAREFYQKFLDQRTNDPRARSDLAWAHGRLSAVTAAMGDPRKGIEHLERSRDSFATLASEHPEVIDHQRA